MRPSRPLPSLDENRHEKKKNPDEPKLVRVFIFGGASRSRTGLHGFAGRCITALLSRRKRSYQNIGATRQHNVPAIGSASRHGPLNKKGSLASPIPGAGDESRTRDLNLGKVALYQLSYSRVFLPTTYCLAAPRRIASYDIPHRNWSGRRVSNSRPQPWQGCALPTELLPQSTSPGSLAKRRAPEKRDYV